MRVTIQHTKEQSFMSTNTLKNSTSQPLFKPKMFILFVCLMVFSGTFNNISAISWRAVYWWRKPVYPQKTTDSCCKSLTTPWSRFELTTSVVIGTDYIGSCKSNYHMIMATTAPTYKGTKLYVNIHSQGQHITAIIQTQNVNSNWSILSDI